MDQRSQHLIQIFEKIGAPLVAAVVQAAPEDDAPANAQKVAELLTKTVKLGIDVAGMAGLGATEGDSVRVALSALAGPLLAELYKNSKQVPSDDDLTKLTSALQSVLTFSEKFTVDSESAARLENIEGQTVALDDHQMHLQYINAFVPLINAVGQFAFGQSEQKVVMDVSIRITSEASNLRKALLPDLSEIDQKRADIAILKALVSVYTACHLAETKRLSGGDGAGSIDDVWKAYEVRYAMVEALAKSLTGAQVDVASSSQAPAQEAPAAAAPPPPPPPAEEAPSAAAPPPAAEAPADNPMAMFSKPKDDAPAETPPAAPPAQEEVPAAPPPETPPAESGDDSGDQSGDSGPMSFFTKKEGSG